MGFCLLGLAKEVKSVNVKSLDSGSGLGACFGGGGTGGGALGSLGASKGTVFVSDSEGQIFPPKGDSSGRMTSIPSMTFSVLPKDMTVRSFSAVVTCILGPSAIF
jgi:hypothetical protein